METELDTAVQIGARIKAARLAYGKARGKKFTQEEFARRLGTVTRGAVGNWEGGKGITSEHLSQVASALEADFDWLATGRGDMIGAPSLPVRGQVGAGDIVRPEDSAEEVLRGASVNLPRTGDAEAYVVRGDSMRPRFFRGEVLIFEREPTKPIGRLLGQFCRAVLPNGSQFVKILRHGDKPGLWTLESIYGDAKVRDVTLKSVHRWLGLLPPRYAHALVIQASQDDSSSEDDAFIATSAVASRRA